MKKQFLWALLVVLAVGGTALALYAVWPILFPRVIAVAPLMPNCDLRQSDCTAILPEGQGKIRFGIQPRSLPVLRPLALVAQVDGLTPLSVSVDFAGTDMNMGYNRVSLHPAGEGLWQGEVTLPVCVRNRMTWEARVLLQSPAGLMAAPFRFDTFSSSSSE